MSITDKELIAFKAITSFIIDVGNQYKNNQKSLSLYLRLIEKTTFTNTEAIKKNTKIFKDFVTENSNAILNEDINLFTSGVIR